VKPFHTVGGVPDYLAAAATLQPAY
jgi:hypothetical protein